MGSLAFSQPAMQPGITYKSVQPKSWARPVSAWQLYQPGPEQ
jgi:hypothetical protein